MYRSRKHPPVSGGKRPLCTLGVPPGRSRGIGECARAPCVSLAAAEGTARGYGRVRGENLFCYLTAGRPRGRHPRRHRGGTGVASRPRALMSLFVVTQISWLRCRRVARLTLPRCSCLYEGGAGLSPCARNTMREAISRDTSSRQLAASMHAGHAVRRNRTI